MSSVQFYDYIGIVGVILTLAAYYLLNMNKIVSESMTYLMLNLVGSCLLLFSLIYSWNLSSVLIEVAWISISVIGIYRSVKLRKKRHVESDKVFALSDYKNRKRI